MRKKLFKFIASVLCVCFLSQSGMGSVCALNEKAKAKVGCGIGIPSAVVGSIILFMCLRSRQASDSFSDVGENNAGTGDSDTPKDDSSTHDNGVQRDMPIVPGISPIRRAKSCPDMANMITENSVDISSGNYPKSEHSRNSSKSQSNAIISDLSNTTSEVSEQNALPISSHTSQTSVSIAQLSDSEIGIPQGTTQRKNGASGGDLSGLQSKSIFPFEISNDDELDNFPVYEPLPDGENGDLTQLGQAPSSHSCENFDSLSNIVTSTSKHSSASPKEDGVYTKNDVDEMRKIAESAGYKFVEKIGRGGFGEVWKCQSSNSTIECVAIKLPIAEQTTRRELKKEWDNCVQMCKLVENNPAIKNYCAIAAPLTQKDIPQALVMDYAEGDLLKGIRKGYYCQTLEDVLDVSLQLAQAVNAVHALIKISHNDVKPENILVFNENGHRVFKLIDFGLASSLTSIEKYDDSGARGYIPRSDISSKDISEAMEKKDVYALGRTFVNFLIPHECKQKRSEQVILTTEHKDMFIMSRLIMNEVAPDDKNEDKVVNMDKRILEEFNVPTNQAKYYVGVNGSYIENRKLEFEEVEKRLLSGGNNFNEEDESDNLKRDILCEYHNVIRQMIQPEHKNRCTIEKAVQQLQQLSQHYKRCAENTENVA